MHSARPGVILVLGMLLSLAAAADPITYQGELQDTESPFTGQVDMTFSLYDSLSGGNEVAGPITVTDVAITDGLFQVELDFGSGALAGDRYLEIVVDGETLQPRQKLTPAPVAVHALNVPDEFWRLGGNAGTSPGTDFIGTADTTPLELRVNDQPVIQIFDAADRDGNHAPNLIAGGEFNVLDESEGSVGGATIAGGGGDPAINSCGPDADSPCVNTVAGDYATVVGGRSNYATGFVATAMGQNTTASGAQSTAMGHNTTASDSESTAMGHYTTASGLSSTAMGSRTTASSFAATAMGHQTWADGWFSMAVGQQARAEHDGTFVWADGENTSFASNGPDQFLIRAAGGVGIGTNSPRTQLDVRHDLASNAATANHAAVFENTGGSSGDVLALKVSVMDPGAAENFITFKEDDGNNIGAIEGDGSGGITLNTSSGDFAERLPKADPSLELPPGTVVGLRAGRIGLETKDAEQVMVISTAPIINGNRPPEHRVDEFASVAFVGQAPVRVRGAVDAGDFLVPSGNNDGTAVAVAEPGPEQVGQIVGRALERSDVAEIAEVTTLVGLPQQGWLKPIVARRDARIEALVDRNAELEARVADLEQQAERTAELEARLAALEALISDPQQVAGQ